MSFDVGVDTRPDFAPWSMQEITDKMRAKKAAGAKDLKGAEVAYPIMPQIPQAVWDALKEAEQHAEEASVACHLRKPGRCVE